MGRLDKYNLPKPIISILKRALYVFRRVNNTKYRKKYIHNSKEFGLNMQQRDYDITVTFTTYPARIDKAKYVADAMLRQTLKPDRVLLVLAKDEYSSKEELPSEYLNLEERGLSIVFINENLKPHKKYYYAMKHFPESLVITVDDDLYYDDDLVETVYSSYLKFPHAINAMRVHRITHENEALKPYIEWEGEIDCPACPTMDLMATGGAGTLYPPHLMHEDLLDEEKIVRLCLNADDIWLKTMQVLKNTPVVLAAPFRPLRTIEGSQDTALWQTNVDENKNDKMITNCLREYDLKPIQFAKGVGDETVRGGSS